MPGLFSLLWHKAESNYSCCREVSSLPSDPDQGRSNLTEEENEALDSADVADTANDIKGALRRACAENAAVRMQGPLFYDVAAHMHRGDSRECGFWQRPRELNACIFVTISMKQTNK